MQNQLSITKEEINKLPQFKYEGEIKLIESKEEALAAIQELKGEKVLGFDTETRAAFNKGESYDVSLLQLATSEKAYLFRLNKLPVISELFGILSNPEVVKAGVAIKDDVKGLQKLHPFKKEGFVDLAVVAREKNIENFSLRALTAILLGVRLTKNAKTSNWERKHLTPAQIHYAACDGAVGYMIYEKMFGIRR